MEVQRSEFGPALIQWARTSASDEIAADVAPARGAAVHRYMTLSGHRAQRFLVGRMLLASAIDEFTDAVDLGFTTTCERCGAEHGRPRLERAPVAVSISYAGSIVAVAAAALLTPPAVGVDIEARAGRWGKQAP